MPTAATKLRLLASGATALLLAGLTACVSTIGNDFDAAKAETFLVGRTTTTEVLSALGKPYSRQISKDGTEQWVYRIDRGTSEMTAAAFVPYFGVLLDNTKTTSVGKKLDMSFADSVMTACVIAFSESSGVGDTTEAIMETASSGFRQEVACGEPQVREGTQ